MSEHMYVKVWDFPTPERDDFDSEDEWLEAKAENPEFPAKFEVCDRCRGTGSHVNPAIDGHGISAEEWANDWDDDERENYLSGRYDIPCEECGGKRVVKVIDEDRVTEQELARYTELLNERWRDEAADRSEAAYFASFER